MRAHGASIAIATEPLVAGGFRVIARDAPASAAHPRRRPDAWAVDRLAAILWHVADVSDVARAVVADHPWGGATGVVATASRPDPAALGLFGSGHADFADPHSANPISTKEH